MSKSDHINKSRKKQIAILFLLLGIIFVVNIKSLFNRIKNEIEQINSIIIVKGVVLLIKNKK